MTVIGFVSYIAVVFSYAVELFENGSKARSVLLFNGNARLFCVSKGRCDSVCFYVSCKNGVGSSGEFVAVVIFNKGNYGIFYGRIGKDNVDIGKNGFSFVAVNDKVKVNRADGDDLEKSGLPRSTSSPSSNAVKEPSAMFIQPFARPVVSS